MIALFIKTKVVILIDRPDIEFIDSANLLLIS